MPTPKLAPEKEREVAALLRQGASTMTIVKMAGVSKGTVGNIRARMELEPPLQAGKKNTDDFNWRDALAPIAGMQKLKSRMSRSEERIAITLGDGKAPIILMGFGDQHIGAYGCDYELFTRLTDEIIETPNLYLALMGDYLEMAIRMRGVLEVTSQVLTPEMQEMFFESWLDDVKGKIAFAVWDNHGVMRQENQAGVSSLKNLLSRRVHYFNGIGHADVKVGSQIYKVAASHKFRGGSMFNRMHAQGRYVRQEANDREVVFMGDIHTWGFMQQDDGGSERTYVTGGTLHTNSGYGKRFFSLHESPHFPCVVFDPKTHEVTPFKTLAQARRYAEAKK